MQKYKCHKIVEAFKIDSIEVNDMGMYVIGGGEDEIRVPREWTFNHKPEIGGYLVRYKDHYMSYSPAEAFEEGYSPLEEA